MEKQLATITILSHDRHNNSTKLQNIFTQNSHLIMSRVGINPQRACLEKCKGLIVLAVEAKQEEIHTLQKKLNDISGVEAKETIMTN